MSGQHQRRCKRIAVWLTPAERQAVARRADECRLTLSAYVRRVIVGKGPQRRRRGDLHRLLHRLDRFVLDLEELQGVARARYCPRVEDGLHARQRALEKLLLEIRDTLKSGR